MDTLVVIQARMASRRRPGKVLAPIAGMPLLELLIRRLRRSLHADRLVVATTTQPEDTAVAELAESLAIPATRGPVDDVLARYRLVLDTLDGPPPGRVVRVTGDNPLTDPELLDATVAAMMAAGADYAYPNQAPVGSAIDVFALKALLRCDAEGHTFAHREHINAYILDHPECFHRLDMVLPAFLQRPDVRITVDTPADLEYVERLLDGVPDPVALPLAEIIARHDRLVPR